MENNEKIYEVIYRAVDELNELREEGAEIEKSAETVLLGPSSKLSSLALVNLIVTIEQDVEETFGVSIVLADEKAMSQRTSPFRTVRTLATYISSLLDEDRDG